MNYISSLYAFIISTYFNDLRCILYISDNLYNYPFNSSLPIINIKNNLKPIFLKNKIFNINSGCQGIIINTKKSIADFQYIEEIIKHSMERFNIRKYVLTFFKNSQENYKDIFLIKEINYVKDLLIIVQNKNSVNDIFDLWSHKYTGLMDKNIPFYLDTWFYDDKTFLYGHNLYPDKISNQQGRQLRMACFKYEPYSICGNNVTNYYGSELRVGVEYAKHYNMTPLLVVDEVDLWGTIFKNWSGNGVLGNIVEDKADIGFSALYTWAVYYEYLDISKPMVRSGITCLVPAPRPIEGLLTPFLSFSNSVWSGLAAVLFFNGLILILLHNLYTRLGIFQMIYNIKKVNKNKNTATVFNIWKLLLNQPLTDFDISNFIAIEFLLLIMFVVNIFLSASYNSGLASIMTVPRYEEPIDTVKDLAQSNINWGANSDAWIISIESSVDELYIKTVQQFKIESDENLRELSKRNNFAFSIERLPFDNYAIGNYIQEDVIQQYYLMKQDIYWEFCVMYTKKSSVILPTLDLFLLRVFESGLISYWQNEAVNLYMDPIVQKAVKLLKKNKKEKMIIKLKLTHVEGPFAFLLIGYITAFLSFLVELLYEKLLSSSQLKRLNL